MSASVLLQLRELSFESLHSNVQFREEYSDGRGHLGLRGHFQDVLEFTVGNSLKGHALTLQVVAS